MLMTGSNTEDTYLHFLKALVDQMIAEKKDLDNIVFLQDNSRVHKTKKISEWFRQH